VTAAAQIGSNVNNFAVILICGLPRA
jgi:hypothetical protein